MEETAPRSQSGIKWLLYISMVNEMVEQVDILYLQIAVNSSNSKYIHNCRSAFNKIQASDLENMCPALRGEFRHSKMFNHEYMLHELTFIYTKHSVQYYRRHTL